MTIHCCQLEHIDLFIILKILYVFLCSNYSQILRYHHFPFSLHIYPCRFSFSFFSMQITIILLPSACVALRGSSFSKYFVGLYIWVYGDLFSTFTFFLRMSLKMCLQEEFLNKATPDKGLRTLLMSMGEAVRTIVFKVSFYLNYCQCLHMLLISCCFFFFFFM